MTDTDFLFRDPGVLRDKELELILIQKVVPDTARSIVPAYEFAMRHVATHERMGRIGLRIDNGKDITHYAGHIGYSVQPEFRGHRYAARSCRLVFPLAREHGINPLWITCNPDNWPSRRTCELVGGEMIEIVALPEGCDMYLRGERLKCRYRVQL